jgi:hypothetical protein
MTPFILVNEIKPDSRNTSVIGSIKCYKNDTYTVSIAHRKLKHRELESIIQVTISRMDHKPVKSWYDFQTIKNELIGPEHTAVEVFPPESQLTDAANCYHLWVYPDPSYKLPFTLNIGRVVISK